jgi:transcriptional regulator with XRE-family HTH domain
MAASEEDIDALVGRRVRELRLQLGLTQTQLANAIGFTFQQVQKYERGSNRISASKLWLIADRLGVSPASLLTGLPSPSGDGVTDGPDGGDDEQARLLSAFGRIADPRRRQTLIDVAEGLGAAPLRRRADPA